MSVGFVCEYQVPKQVHNLMALVYYLISFQKSDIPLMIPNNSLN